jgi:hypothetical protein
VWSSREAYGRDRVRLESRWQLQNPIRTGHVADLHEPPTPWWKRIRLHTAVLAVAAFLGGLEAIRAHYDWLFLRPQLFARADRSMNVNYVAGQLIDETITVTNRTPVRHDDISFRAQSATGGVEKLAVDPPRIRSLGSGDSMSLRLLGSTAGRGSHVVTLTVASKAGVIPPAQDLHFDIPLRVWPAEPLAGVTAEGWPPGQLGGWIETGYAAEAGLTCTVEITGDYGIDDVMVDMAGTGTNPPWAPAGSGATRTGFVEWRTRKIEAFRRTSFRLIVSTDRTLDWQAVARNSVVTCTENTPKEGGQP